MARTARAHLLTKPVVNVSPPSLGAFRESAGPAPWQLGARVALRGLTSLIQKGRPSSCTAGRGPSLPTPWQSCFHNGTGCEHREGLPMARWTRVCNVTVADAIAARPRHAGSPQQGRGRTPMQHCRLARHIWHRRPCCVAAKTPSRSIATQRSILCGLGAHRLIEPRSSGGMELPRAERFRWVVPWAAVAVASAGLGSDAVRAAAASTTESIVLASRAVRPPEVSSLVVPTDAAIALTHSCNDCSAVGRVLAASGGPKAQAAQYRQVNVPLGEMRAGLSRTQQQRGQGADPEAQKQTAR